MDSSITRYFPARIASALSEVKYGGISEIRLRISRPPALTSQNGILYLMSSGGVSSDPAKGMTVTSDDIRKTFDAVCQYSLHSWHSQIAQCYVTVPGGHRVGISGTAVISGGRTETVRDIGSINFRIAREINGAADNIVNSEMNGRLRSILLCGRPGSGKTTILRDLCRQIGNKYPTALIDERCEIAACSRGMPQNDVGLNTDVFSGFSKAEGILTALRVMSPRMMICDEIGGAEDVDALLASGSCGVNIAASVHGGSPEDIFRRAGIRRLIEAEIFDSYAYIRGGRAEKICSFPRQRGRNGTGGASY